MGTLIKIIVALVVVTGCFNASRFALNNYQFEDAVHEALLFDPGASDKELVATIMKLGAEYQVPITPEGIKVRQRGDEIVVEMSYTDTVALVPGIYSTDWTFTPSTSTRLLFGKRR
jgi:hypothetical protein